MTLFFSFGIINVLLGLVVGITIETTLGNISGVSFGTYSRFSGLPYTEYPPTGNNRFLPTEKRTSLYSSSVYNATEIGSKCMQSSGEGDEDCLFINVWTPNITGNYSVMVWIHGGGFDGGDGYGGSYGLYDGYNFMSRNVVYVSFNYRLGLLGFLPLNEIYQETNTTNGGLNGVYDQIIALQWIKSYISDYGGNPNDVTIFGESAGGMFVCALLFSPIATDLFNKAILQSGPCTYWYPKAEGENLAKTLFNNTNLTYLRSLTAQQIINHKEQDKASICTVDGYILPINNAEDIYLMNTVNANKIMTGFTYFDQLLAWPYKGGRWWNGLYSSPKNENELRQYINAYFDQSSDNLADMIINNYFVDWQSHYYYNKYQLIWFALSQGDAWFSCGSFNLVNYLLSDANNFNGNAYLYTFLGTVYPYYAVHFSEVPFIFGSNTNWVLNTPFYGGNQTSNINWNQTLSDTMTDLWCNFAKDINDINLGDPYNITKQNAILFGGGQIIQHVNNYYNEYHGGYCKFLSNQSTQIIRRLRIPLMGVNITTYNPTNTPSQNPTNAPTTGIPTNSPFISETDLLFSSTDPQNIDDGDRVACLNNFILYNIIFCFFYVFTPIYC